MKREDVRGGISIALTILVIVGVILFIGIRNADVENRINSCLRRGGTPIVTSSRSINTYHGCAVP